VACAGAKGSATISTDRTDAIHNLKGETMQNMKRKSLTLGLVAALFAGGIAAAAPVQAVAPSCPAFSQTSNSQANPPFTTLHLHASCLGGGQKRAILLARHNDPWASTEMFVGPWRSGAMEQSRAQSRNGMMFDGATWQRNWP